MHMSSADHDGTDDADESEMGSEAEDGEEHDASALSAEPRASNNSAGRSLQPGRNDPEDESDNDELLDDDALMGIIEYDDEFGDIGDIILGSCGRADKRKRKTNRQQGALGQWDVIVANVDEVACETAIAATVQVELSGAASWSPGIWKPKQGFNNQGFRRRALRCSAQAQQTRTTALPPSRTGAK